MGIEQHPGPHLRGVRSTPSVIIQMSPDYPVSPGDRIAPGEIQLREGSTHSREAGMLHQHVINIGEQ